MKLSLRAFFAIATFAVSSFSTNEQTTEDIHVIINNAIDDCNKKLDIVTEQRERIKKITKHLVLFGLRRVYLSAFDFNLAEFLNHATHTEPLSASTQPAKISEALKNYSQNCTLFFNGMMGFADFIAAKNMSSLTRGHRSVFRNWLKEAASSRLDYQISLYAGAKLLRR